MSETRAIVTELDGDYALVRTEEGGCGRCHESGGCGGANISQMLCSNKERRWRVLNPRGAAVGEHVNIRVADGAVRSGATLLYVIPLVAFIVGALVGGAWLSEPGAIGGAISGMGIAWLWVARRVRQRHCDPRFQPHIV